MSAGPKLRPNHRRYLQALARLTPEQRLRKAFELTDWSRSLFVHGLRRRFPDLSPDAFESLLRSRLDKCHNRTY